MMHVRDTTIGLLLTAFYLSAGCVAFAGEPDVIRKRDGRRNPGRFQRRRSKAWIQPA